MTTYQEMLDAVKSGAKSVAEDRVANWREGEDSAEFIPLRDYAMWLKTLSDPQVIDATSGNKRTLFKTLC